MAQVRRFFVFAAQCGESVIMSALDSSCSGNSPFQNTRKPINEIASHTRGQVALIAWRVIPKVNTMALARICHTYISITGMSVEAVLTLISISCVLVYTCLRQMWCEFRVRPPRFVLVSWRLSQDIGDGAWGHKYQSPEHGPIHHVKFFYDKSHLSLPQS